VIPTGRAGFGPADDAVRLSHRRDFTSGKSQVKQAPPVVGGKL
jgi:hypothetical protein